MFSALASALGMGGDENSLMKVADSPTSPGKKSLLSEPLPGVDAPKLLELIEKHVRAGKTKAPRSASCDISDKDGGILVADHFKIPAMFGGGEHSVYNLYKIDAATSTVEIQFYPSEFQWKRSACSTSSWIKVLSDPDVRVEFWTDQHEVRLSGPMMQGMLNEMLKFYGAPESAKCDQPAVGKDGAFSAMTDPIEGSELTADNYFDKFREFLREKSNLTELPDDTMVEERSGILGELAEIAGGRVSRAKHTINKGENHLYCQEYGHDEEMKDLISITHVQVHKEPFRVEQWNEPIAQRLTDIQSTIEDQKKLIEDFLTKVLAEVQES